MYTLFTLEVCAVIIYFGGLAVIMKFGPGLKRRARSAARRLFGALLRPLIRPEVYTKFTKERSE